MFFIRFVTKHACQSGRQKDGQTDGRTDRHNYDHTTAIPYLLRAVKSNEAVCV